MNKYQHTLEKLENNTAKRSIALVIEGALIGVLAGLTAVLYRYCLTYAESGLYAGSEFHTRKCRCYRPLVCRSYFDGMYCRKDCEMGANGCRFRDPAGFREVRGYLDQSFWRVVLAKFTGGTLSIFGGLSLGREGPSIQLGAMVAKSYSRLRNYDKTTEIGLLSCGAGAGLAAAFNAPLAGIMFVLEEIHHTFDRTMLVAGLIATVCADFVSKIFFGQSAIFSFTTSTLALRYYWLLALLGILLGLAGAGYNFVMLKMQAFFHRLKKIPKEIRIAFVFVISGILGLTLPQVLAGGHSMIALLEHGKPELSMICILLVVKFLFSAVSFGCGAPGGIFFPTSDFRRLHRGNFRKPFHPRSLPAKRFTSPVYRYQHGRDYLRASCVHRLPVLYLITEDRQYAPDVRHRCREQYCLYHRKPAWQQTIYTSLLENILNKQTELEIKESAEKVLVTYVIPFDSPVCHKKICQIDWQKNTLVASIERDGHTITPKGDTEILPGDLLMVLIGRQYYAADYAAYEKLING